MSDVPQADHPPAVPVGFDAYLDWALWPLQRLGVRAYLRSTYDRTGRNNTADASHYLYQVAENFNVTLDVEGSGILYFVRANRWHGSPWHFEIDGADHVVAETTTADPLTPLADSVFLPERAFPAPLAVTYATTHGADLCWVPMPFDERLRIAHSRTYYGTGYYIYHLLAEPSALPAWTPSAVPDPAALEVLSRAGQAPLASESLEPGGVQTLVTGTNLLTDSLTGPAMIRALTLSAPAERARDLARVRLVATWDDRAQPSIDAPVGLFFGAGTLANPDDREWLVRSLPMSIRFRSGRVQLACYFPMPFFRSARIEIVAPDGLEPIVDLRWSAATRPYAGPWNHVGYFHATHRDHGIGRPGIDHEFLDTEGVEGAPEWSGSVVGTSFVFTRRNVLTTLEGDPRFYFDDSETPQAQGTGTEEWAGGGDYWGGLRMTLPLAGHPTGAPAGSAIDDDPESGVHSAYRYLVADAMPFGRRARVTFEHGGENESVEEYESVTCWYGLPSPSLVLTDMLDVGNPASESTHGYRSPDATPPYQITSRYEWGPDHLPVAMSGPLAAPDDHVDFEFEAAAGRYEIWVEVRVGETLFDAAVWLQLDGDIGTSTSRIEHTGSMGILNAGREPGSYAFVSGARPACSVALDAGRHRLRVQPRHGLLRFARILLTPHPGQRPAPDHQPATGEIELGPTASLAPNGAFEIVDDPRAPGDRAIGLGRLPPEMEIFPARTMSGRRTEGISELTLAVVPDNHGVLLRRTLDYGYANQRARVQLEVEGEWRDAGIWYLAGSNTVYHSFPWTEGELAPVRPVTVTSNRRFRDDEFLLPASLTRGLRELRLRFEFEPRNPPLLPGQEPLPSAWTELAYRAYAWVMPQVTLPSG